MLTSDWTKNGGQVSGFEAGRGGNASGGGVPTGRNYRADLLTF